MNENPLHNPGLESLEARLSATPPRLAEPDCQRLLYQCAFAAGQAIAQRAVARQRRGWMTVAGLLALVSVGLSLQVIRLTDSARHDFQENSIAVRGEVGAGTKLPVFIPASAVEAEQLSVASSVERAVDFDWPPRPFAADTSQQPATDMPEPVLTPLSRFAPGSS